MPTYTFRREDGNLVEKRLSFSEYKKVKAGDTSLTDKDGAPLEPVFSATPAIGFVLRDGVSGGWASKAMKENKFRKKRNRRMAQREKDHVFKNKLIPNYKGAEAPTWQDARDEAVAKAEPEVKDAVKASYDPLVAKEKA